MAAALLADIVAVKLTGDNLARFLFLRRNRVSYRCAL
jgi:hypothetical protein